MDPPAADAQNEREGFLAQVDSFLVDALENPRHRLTVLRMELAIQRFMQNPDQHQFEFQHLSTSYLRCAAHRVAQHYGLHTMSLDNAVDGLGSRVIARKTPNSKYPAVCLSEVPPKQNEKEIAEQFKIAIRPRPMKACLSDDGELGLKKGEVRSMEERKEEYDRARARIFSGSSSSEGDGSSPADSIDRRSLPSSMDEQEYAPEEIEKTHSKDSASRVAIFRDMEKDRTDPDYDRSYERYVRGPAAYQNFGLQACNILQPPFVQYEADVSSFSPMSRNLANPSVNPYFAFGYDQNTKDAFCMQWPNPAMMYAYSYEHFRQAKFQAPLYQQPLSFEHPRNF
ncbi:uncharacterized protein LOC135617682 [Musa acuminata AAA Group]|uniref:uncharacterized protein LOC135617682 n=1 Tax=Musa acuminata AAA Group TaxID=214697 RepID=UPI0031CF53D6